MMSSDMKAIAANANHLYESAFRKGLERSDFGRYATIESVSEEYFLGDTFDEAVDAAMDKHPERLTHTIRIGHRAAIHLGIKLALISALLLAYPASLHAGDAPAKRPNILHIHADDHRPDALGAFGHPVLKTPNLDTLVKRGFAFTHCYTMGSMVGAVCQPSRTMMLTGKSWLRIPTKKGEPESSLPRVMRRAGYFTFHVGKPGNEYTAGLQAFDVNLSMPDATPAERRGSGERHADATIK